MGVALVRGVRLGGGRGPGGDPSWLPSGRGAKTVAVGPGFSAGRGQARCRRGEPVSGTGGDPRLVAGFRSPRGTVLRTRARPPWLKDTGSASGTAWHPNA